MIHFIDFRETSRIIFIFDRKSVRFRDRPENTGFGWILRDCTKILGTFDGGEMMIHEMLRKME